MRTNIAPTTIYTGIDEKLKVKDAADITGATGNTSVIDALSGMKDEVVDTLRKTPQLASRLTQLVLDVKNGRATGTDTASRIASVFSNRGGVLDDLSNRAKGVMQDSLGMSPALANQVFIAAKGTVLAGTAYLGSSRDISSASGVASTLQRLLNDKDAIQYVDLSAQASLLSGVMNEAIKSGIPQGIDMLMKQAATDAQRSAIASQNLYAVVFSGNLDTVEAMVKYVTPEAIKARYPTFARDFLAQYTLLATDNPLTYAPAKARILALFRLIDPVWDITMRNGAPVPSLAPFVSASSDAVKVFATSDEYRNAMTIAPGFKSVEAKAWIKQHYSFFPA
jgi:hypothetical protein